MTNLTLIVDGFPRTGNTFLDAALKIMYPGVDVGQGITHSTSVMFRSMKNNPNIRYILPLREPVATIESGTLMSMFSSHKPELDEVLSEKIAGYCNHHYLFLDRKNIFVAPFDIFTSNINSLLDQLETYIPELVGKREAMTHEECFTKVRESRGYGDAPIKDTVRANLPRDRHPYRDVISSELMSHEKQEHLLLASTYYNLLTSRYYENRQLL